MTATSKKQRPRGKTQAMERYIAEIDRFATLLRDLQEQIAELKRDEVIAKQVYDEAKAATREAKEQEHNTVSLLLKFVTPGSIDVMPLFDTMEEADEELHGEAASEWRKEPIVVLKLSAAATRALIEADIVLVGQLQDRVLRDGMHWHDELEPISDGMAEAIESKLNDFINNRTTQ